MAFTDLWRRHVVFTRGNEMIVINYNRLTGRARDAALLRDDIVVDQTTDLRVVTKDWIAERGEPTTS